MPTPDVINQIQHAIETDDYNQSERLIATYEAADSAAKALIDDVLITVCGFSLPSLMDQAGRADRFLED